jgi:hypothetical protein
MHAHIVLCRFNPFHFTDRQENCAVARSNSQPREIPPWIGDGVQHGEHLAHGLIRPRCAKPVPGPLERSAEALLPASAETFDEGSTVDKLDAKAHEACHQCHIARKDQEYVFSKYRER